jgi:hypothetical protein
MKFSKNKKFGFGFWVRLLMVGFFPKKFYDPIFISKNVDRSTQPFFQPFLQ